jgi:hypothetical protein
MELHKVFYEFLIVTVPAVALYFTGWGYLYYYLDAFGISISEVHIDVPTIFIYSLPVVQDALERYLGFLIFVVLFAPAVCVIVYSQSNQKNKERIESSLASMRGAVSKMSVWSKLAILIVFMGVSAFSMLPVINRAAQDTASRVWKGPATFVIALPSLSDKIKSSPLEEQYDSCSKAESLRLIYSDDSAYYLLCVNAGDDSGQGDVFEVRRKEGLVSVRFAASG